MTGWRFARLDELDGPTKVMLKLTIPDIDGFYSRLVAHPNVLRVVALSDHALAPTDTDVIHVLFKQSGMLFDGKADNPHLPHNYVPNTVAYTGTHDNATTRGWFK